MNLLVDWPVPCPYCFEEMAFTIDTSQGDHSTVEDCAVCCRPVAFRISCRPGEVESVEAEPA